MLVYAQPSFFCLLHLRLGKSALCSLCCLGTRDQTIHNSNRAGHTSAKFSGSLYLAEDQVLPEVVQVKNLKAKNQEGHES